LWFAEFWWRAILRPLPDKNELKNAYYFTYRVGFIICDSGLGPEEAQLDMKAGKCNQDFRLMGSDFQRRVVSHYSFGGRPPLEEAIWMLTSPENFQLRTLNECPAMQIIGYLLAAEARLYVHGASPDGPAAELVQTALEQVQQVPADVYTALAKAWPMETAMDRFQQTAYKIRQLVHKRRDSPNARFRVQVVVCQCNADLTWLRSLALAEDIFAMFIYDSCSSDAPSVGSRSECGMRGVLSHILTEVPFFAEQAPDFVVFLPAIAAEGSEKHLLEMVFQSMSQRTLDTAFLPLGFHRRPPTPPTPCERAVWRDSLGLGLPTGYEGAILL